ncbi:hypothetical protein KUV80_11215 [Fictibacillus nanhaiensis]|uniref:hypothetical protein n=1 Tax=Fictibacillus nanhaiensis TaxID=742169 RepID=UPI001C9858C9|nr:hypothetical protein [Fictibacillus nanhaiensis]MBY6037229.1 hypothetical protein [Fictibacillus nanhaiensis]
MEEIAAMFEENSAGFEEVSVYTQQLSATTEEINRQMSLLYHLTNLKSLMNSLKFNHY